MDSTSDGFKNPFSKTICTICYEDLKPIVEDLQSISICGHVFHELCLQQWMEYCPSKKKSSCPVCKQGCCQKDVIRLYFQSLGGETTQSIYSPNQSHADSEVLYEQTIKLERKLIGLTTSFENQQKHVKELNEEIALHAERAQNEQTLKEEILKEKTHIWKLLQMKTEELDKSTMECTRLQERSMALAKELATLKLLSDLNLEDEEVTKLASIGGGPNSKDTVDILKKSLILRNKSYKELMAQCNLLGRGEIRCLKKLEKSEEKIKKLKTRVQELERFLEKNDNEALRNLKIPPKDIMEGTSEDSYVKLLTSHKEIDKPFVSKATQEVIQHRRSLYSGHDREIVNLVYVNEDDAEVCPIQMPYSATTHGPYKDDTCIMPMTQATYVPKCDYNEYHKHNEGRNNNFERKDNILMHHVAQASPCNVFLPSKRTSSENVDQQEDHSSAEHIFSGSLLPATRPNTFMGRWRKQVSGNVSSPMTKQGAGSTGDLIAVGADGRGGRIKILRAASHYSGNKGSSSMPKRYKCVGKDNSQSPGCLQIEHFFRKDQSQL